jgi:hypothetical protein
VATELDARARRKSARLTRWAVALTLISLLALFNWRVPVLRLEDFRANQLVLVVLLLLPIPAAVLFAAGLGSWRRAIVLAALIPLLVLDSCNALLVSLDLSTRFYESVDHSFEPIASSQFASSRVVLYRTNCGATCAFGLEARQERAVIPGFLNVVRVLGKWYPGSEGDVVRINPRRARVVTNGIPHSAIPERSEFTLRPWIYF